jgi:hypothetical protein
MHFKQCRALWKLFLVSSIDVEKLHFIERNAHGQGEGVMKGSEKHQLARAGDRSHTISFVRNV